MRSAEENPEEAVAVEATDEESAALDFATRWDNLCGDHPILNGEYEDGFEVIITDTAADQALKHQDRWQRFRITGELVPHYAVTPD